MYAVCTSHGAFMGFWVFWVGCCQVDGVLVVIGCLGDAVNLTVHVTQQMCWRRLGSHLLLFPWAHAFTSWAFSLALRNFFFLVGVMCVVCLCGTCVWWFMGVCRPVLNAQSSFSSQCFFNYKLKLTKKYVLWGGSYGLFDNRIYSPSMRTWAWISGPV